MYIFKQLNRLHLSNTFIDNKLKKFHFWHWLYLYYAINFDYKKLSNLDNFFLNNTNSNFSNIPNNLFNLKYGYARLLTNFLLFFRIKQNTFNFFP